MVLQHRRAEMNPEECSRVNCIGIDELRADLEVARKQIQVADQARQAQLEMFTAWQKLQNGSLNTLTTATGHLQTTLNESIVKSNQVLWGLVTAAVLLVLNLVAGALKV